MALGAIITDYGQSIATLFLYCYSTRTRNIIPGIYTMRVTNMKSRKMTYTHKHREIALPSPNEIERKEKKEIYKKVESTNCVRCTHKHTPSADNVHTVNDDETEMRQVKKQRRRRRRQCYHYAL